jgi:hypothetical protein
VTVEIVPHFWPEAFAIDVIEHYRKRPMRFTGQLSFDGAHRSCRNDTDTVRISWTSVWEIHLAYAADVCTSVKIDQCKADVEANWCSGIPSPNDLNEGNDGE